MTFTLYATFIGIFLFTVLIIWNVIYYREKITCMTGMMIAMALGMSAGLTIGVILGILFSGNLFYSTVLAMIIGLAAGFLAGMPISLMAVLDGILSGLMGGMMGAMLGEMITPEYHDSIIKLMFLLFIGTMIILFRMMDQEFIKKKGWLAHPAVMVIIFILIIIGYNQLDPVISTPNPSNNSNHNHHSMGTQTLVVQGDEFSFSPSQVEAVAGEMVTIELDNIGEIEHDLEILDMEAETVEASALHDHQHGNNQVHIHSMPGEKQTLTFIPLNPGVYRYICTIPGHAESGMTGKIEITS